MMTDTMVLERPITEVQVEHFVQREPQHERRWIRGWAEAPVRIRGLGHLMVLLITLSPDNDHAGVTDDLTGAWAQVKRLSDRWWVEGWNPTDDWPSVFVPEGWLERTGRRSMDDHACWSHPVAAELIWAFLDGRSITGAIRLPAPGRKP